MGPLATDKTMLGQVYSRPIAALLISLIGGIVLGYHFPGHIIGGLVIGLFVAAYFGVSIIRNKAAGFIPLIFFIVLGYASVQPWVSPNFASNHIQNFSDETRWQIAGVVDSHPVELAYLKRFVLCADTLKHKKTSHPVTGKIRVTVSGPGPAFVKGDRVMFRSRLRRIQNFNNPGGFNYQRYMAFKGIWRTAYAKGSRLEVVQKKTSKDLPQQLNDARRAMAELIERAGNEPSAAVLKALIIGERAAISSEVRDAFNRAGVGHILAISGLHIGIVATVAFVLFHKLLCFIRPLLWRAWTQKGAAVFALFPVFVYGLISGMSPSTQRAVIMITAFLMTFLVERERDTANTLALAAFIILIVYPPSFFSISFQLSFLAVLSILYGWSRTRPAQSANRRNAKNGFRFQVRRKIRAFFLVSLFAICGTLPLVMFYFNQISFIGFLANFIIVPLVGFVVVPLGLLALFIYPLSSQLAFTCAQICIFLLDYVLIIVKYLANLPFAAVKTFTPSLFEMVCYYVLGWAVLDRQNADLTPAGFDELPRVQAERCPPAARYLRRPGRFGRDHFFFAVAAMRRWLAAGFVGKRSAIVGLVVILALAADAGYWLVQRYWRADLRVTFIDVGQGNAVLLESPGGLTTLIDGGGFSDNNVFDMGARVLAPFLWRKKIRTIDTLVLTHPNSDHLNGLIFIARHFNVKTIWTNSEAKTTWGYQHFKRVIEQKRIDLPDFRHLPRKQLINGVEFNILYPPADFLAKTASQKWRDTNNNSLVLKVTFNDISFLFPGDIMAEAEKELVDLAGADLACDILLVPHHGSRSSSSRRFLAKVRPNIAVISAGWKNRFGFPHRSVLEAYQKSGSRIFRTDRNGAIIFTTNGKSFTVKPVIAAANLP